MDTRLDALKTASKNVVHTAAEETGELIGNKTIDTTVKAMLVILPEKIK